MKYLISQLLVLGAGGDVGGVFLNKLQSIIEELTFLLDKVNYCVHQSMLWDLSLCMSINNNNRGRKADQSSFLLRI